MSLDTLDNIQSLMTLVPEFSGVKVVISITFKFVADEDHVAVVRDVVWKTSAIFGRTHFMMERLHGQYESSKKKK